jgi:hypothetical protein
MICLFLVGVGEATVPRAFVSINGSDASPCSAVQPCRSFSQALTVVQPGGEIVVQDSGGYSTGFTITHSVTIDAGTFNASVISTSATDLCTINAGASGRVVLRGISFHGAGIGNNAINVAQVGSLYVDHCSISEFSGDGVSMPNGGNLFVTATDVRASSAGIRLNSAGTTAANLTARDSQFTECAVGVLLHVLTNRDAIATLSNCTASVCTDGFFAMSDSSGGARMTLTNCRSMANLAGILVKSTSGGDATIRLANCAVTDNQIGFEVVQTGSAVPMVLGTLPATNLVDGNFLNLSTNGNLTLQ